MTLVAIHRVHVVVKVVTLVGRIARTRRIVRYEAWGTIAWMFVNLWRTIAARVFIAAALAC